MKLFNAILIAGILVACLFVSIFTIHQIATGVHEIQVEQAQRGRIIR